MKTVVHSIRSLVGICLLLVLSACGGGGGGGFPSVTVLSASPAQYSRTMTVSVSGADLTSSDIYMWVEGPCGPVTKVTGGTDLLQQFTCKVTGLGDMILHVNTPEGTEIAKLGLNIPVPQVSMRVTQGSLTGVYVVELDPTAAPITVNNFLTYVNAGFYSSTIFHRVIAGFVAQGGGYTAGPTKKSTSLPAIALEANNGLKNQKYTIAMARTNDPNSATSEFYVNLVDNPDLDYGSTVNPAGYAVFGKVVSGFDVIDAIGNVAVIRQSATFTNLPVQDVVITAAAQTR